MSDRNKSAEETAAAVAQLRELLTTDEERGQSDSTLARFLVARDFNLDHARDMLVNTLKWRQENKVDEIALPPKGPLLLPVRGYDVVPDGNASKSVPEDFKKIISIVAGGSFHKLDKLGGPLFIERVGRHDAKLIAQKITADMLLRYHIANNEFVFNVLMAECSKKAGKPVEKMTVIFDLDGLGFHQFVMPALNILKAMGQVDQDHYPERIRRLFIVNAPKIFVTFWSVLSSVLDKGLLDKIKILGEDFKETVLEYVDADNLPQHLGGNCNCAHVEGGCVPLRHYDEKTIKMVLGDDDSFDQEAELVDRVPFRAEFPVDKEGIRVSWRFKTNKYPCAFAVTFVPTAGYQAVEQAVAGDVVDAASDVMPEGVVVVPKQIYESNKDVCQGASLATGPGTFILQWENTKKAVGFLSGYGARNVFFAVTVDADVLTA